MEDRGGVGADGVGGDVVVAGDADGDLLDGSGCAHVLDDDVTAISSLRDLDLRAPDRPGDFRTNTTQPNPAEPRALVFAEPIAALAAGGHDDPQLNMFTSAASSTAETAT